MRIEKSPYSQFRKPEKVQNRLVWKTLNADTPKWNFSLFEQTSLRESSDANIYSSEGQWKGPSRKQRKH